MRQRIRIFDLRYWGFAVTWLIYLFFLFVQQVALAQDFWQPTNGLAVGSPFAILPTSDERIFVGTERGVFCSNDYGKAWRKLGSEFKDSQIRDLKFDANGDILAATFDKGIFRSRNKGENWTSQNNGLTNLAIRALAISPNGSWFTGTVISGIFRSTDQGQSWVSVNNGLDDLRISCLVIDQDGDVFAGTGMRGIYRLVNNGVAWAEVNNGLKELLESTYRSTNALAITKLGHLFAATSAGVYRSKDRGGSWQRVMPGYFHTLAVLQDQASVLIASSEIHLSTDNGDTWKKIGISDYSFYRIYSLTQTPKGHLLAGTSEGVFLKIAGTDGWQRINNALPADPATIAVHPNGDVYVGAFGIYTSHNDGGGWRLAFSDSISRSYESLAFNSKGHVFVGASSYSNLSGPRVFRSTDLGKTWEIKDKGLEQLSDPGSALTLGISRGGVIFAGRRGVFRSTDNGESWKAINNGLPPTYISSIAIDSSQSVLLATVNGLFRSFDQGDHWMPLNNPAPTIEIRSLLVNAKGFIFAGSWGQGVYRSKDNGVTWEKLANGLPMGEGVSAMAILPNQDLYVGSNAYVGIYYSRDDGETWQPINSGLLRNQVQSIAGSPRGYVFAALGGDFAFQDNVGIFRSVHPIAVKVDEKLQGEKPTTFLLAQNYPNPFNSSTLIEFILPVSGYVSLKVFDVLGVEIESLVSENLLAGKHRIQWRAQDKPNGIYFYKLQVGNSSNLSRYAVNKTYKLILLR